MHIELDPKVVAELVIPKSFTFAQVLVLSLVFVVLLSVLLRVFAVPAMRARPGKFQNFAEAAIGGGATYQAGQHKGAMVLKNVLTTLVLYGVAFGLVKLVEFALGRLSEHMTTFVVDDIMVLSAIVMGILILLALVCYFFVVPRFKYRPGKLQSIVEMAVQGMGSLSVSHVGNKIGTAMAPYVTTIGLYIFTGGLIELLGMRAPASDINVTAALALMTFFLINYFAFREKGLKGRLHHYKPYWISPIILVTDLAAPISMACRLYGNMLAALVVMELLYGAVPIFFPAVVSIYFNLFHAALQAYIFMTLTLAFISENIE